MPNQIMPDSDYDIDSIGYAILWQITKQFHADLLLKSQLRAAHRNRKKIDNEDVQDALQTINQEIHSRLTAEERSRRPKLPSLRDVLLAVGSGLVSIFLGEIVRIALNRQMLNSVDAIYWLALVVGVVLFIPFAQVNAQD